ncbi:class F sortase [Streptomyces caniferus]|uniref:Class F sortase n=1 Tax=Streptomyces caniferus TaxID=285557 RepID=A0A640SLT8_9ACTN|nr:class F sortase [Streptomyces caniferus]GFE11712.1 class F sortase [Streptomyces caniferus]
MSPTDPPEATAGEPAAARRPRWGVLALAGLIGLGMVRQGLSGEADGPPQPEAGTALFPGDLPPDGPAPPPLPRSAPSRVAIASLDVSAPLMPLGLGKDGWIEAPPADEPRLAGWYEGAPTPGENGTAVIVGHVDSLSGPAVFYGLGALEKGRTIRVTRRDGRTAVFEVYGIQVFDKRKFPAKKVYGATGRPELRVLTCGGAYEPGSGYASNVVVFARMTRAGADETGHR